MSTKVFPAASVLQSMRQRIGGVREVSFGKRCVELRSVASAYGQSPKEVLFETFKKSKRAALTDKSKRMSRRLADLSPKMCGGVSAMDRNFVHGSVRFGRVDMASVSEASVSEASVRKASVRKASVSEASMASKKSGQWRQLSDCVSVVLRDVRKAPEAKAERSLGAKLN